MMWFDKLAFIGIFVAFIGFVMFITGFWFMIDAKREARAELRASIQAARDAIHAAPKQ